MKFLKIKFEIWSVFFRKKKILKLEFWKLKFWKINLKIENWEIKFWHQKKEEIRGWHVVAGIGRQRSPCMAMRTWGHGAIVVCSVDAGGLDSLPNGNI